jgi:DNA-binding NtrC family response regulator
MAFTGASEARKGVFEQAHGGTLFIDEIGDLDVSLQAKLLRALESSAVQRVGGKGFRRFDVRILAATRRDLDTEVTAGRFRDDLYYRLAVARVHLPPLRERVEDIAPLAHAFFAQASVKVGVLDEAALFELSQRRWAGNIRQLRNAVLRLAALGELPAPESRPQGRDEGADPLSADANVGASSGTFRAAQSSPSRQTSAVLAQGDDFVKRILLTVPKYSDARDMIVNEFTNRFCAYALEQHGGNVTKASKASGIARRYFYVLKKKGEKSGPL